MTSLEVDGKGSLQARFAVPAAALAEDTALQSHETDYAQAS